MCELSKYRAKKVAVDGITFYSKKEALRYKELKLLEKSGEIQNLRLQVPFELIPNQYEYYLEEGRNGKIKFKKKIIERKVKYIADFVYETGDIVKKTIVEDTKGYKNGGAYSVFVIKRKLMLQVHGIKIVEV